MLFQNITKESFYSIDLDKISEESSLLADFSLYVCPAVVHHLNSSGHAAV